MPDHICPFDANLAASGQLFDLVILRSLTESFERCQEREQIGDFFGRHLLQQ